MQREKVQNKYLLENDETVHGNISHPLPMMPGGTSRSTMEDTLDPLICTGQADMSFSSESQVTGTTARQSSSSGNLMTANGLSILHRGSSSRRGCSLAHISCVTDWNPGWPHSVCKLMDDGPLNKITCV